MHKKDNVEIFGSGNSKTSRLRDCDLGFWSCAIFQGSGQYVHNYFNTDNLLPRDDATKEVVWHDRHQLFRRLSVFGRSVDRSVPILVILCMLPYAGFNAWGSGGVMTIRDCIVRLCKFREVKSSRF
uniref:Uncharacterized protein n=1 Tax=Wuchereria bancrofti TaxID=6293 RepID=A0A1I8ECG3_WUCBA